MPSPDIKNAGVLARLKAELARVSRFGLVGTIATAIHVLVVAMLVTTDALPVLAANAVAYSSAFAVGFAGHYYWTFHAPGNPCQAIRRYFIISALAFSVNTIVLSALLSAEWLSPLASTITAVAVVPLLSFLASRQWGFRGESS